MYTLVQVLMRMLQTLITTQTCKQFELLPHIIKRGSNLLLC